jgi:hypothetical protein
MSVRPENHFVCDRCGVEAYEIMSNGPVHTRAGGPGGWLVLVIGTDPTTPPAHLCDVCAAAFETFMAREKGGRPIGHPPLKCPGVGRDKDHDRALAFYFSRPVTDDEMRYLHEVMQRAV